MAKRDFAKNEMEQNVPAEATGVAEPVAEGAEATEEGIVQYQLDDGTMGSRSAYIRQEFKKDRSRKEIADELGVKYYIVYSATANMFNAVHPENSTGTSNRSVAVEDPRDPSKKIPRAQAMKILFEGDEEAGVAPMERQEIAEKYNCPYATVYAATKDCEGSTPGRVRATLTHPETGKEVNRVDYIRELFANGMGRRDIAVHITKMTGELCDYSTVWAATKPAKKEEDKATTEPAVAEETAE